ncbi:MAG TPA: grasp-with-spasm system ATP-grasp peptide maturase [Flavisolibacter sp.]|nr:grasp-with-spasm system ATP-grasp peptide maturase [Flavisolibacter sp.]
MILIISSSEDVSTDHVINWLHYHKKKFYRLNFFDILDAPHKNEVCYSLEDNTLQINSQTIDLNDINSVWLRKLGSFKKSVFYKSCLGEIRQDILIQQTGEFNAFVMAIIKNINPNSYWITHYGHRAQNKWNVLKKAAEAGLSIPKTFFTNTKKHLTAWRNHLPIINKPLNEPYFFTKGKNFFTMYTKEIADKEMAYLPDNFFPSAIQNKIQKEYEIRTFFLDKKYYSMAIFSQNDQQTAVDFRNYNTTCPNRFIPYQLPREVEKKLDVLMDSLNLNCGSIDMIKEKKGDYIFLEVNPNGQFGMVDFPCNYNLHKIVAEKLIERDKISTS